MKSDLDARLRDVDRQIEREEARPPDRRDTGQLARLFEQRGQTEAERIRLVAAMERESPRYASLKYPRPCSLVDGRAGLAEDEVALLDILGTDESYLIVVAKRDEAETAGLAIHVLPPAGTVAELVAAATRDEALQDDDRTREIGGQAYRMLLVPAAEFIRGKGLVIVPGGALGSLPFELLVEPNPGEDGGRFLLEGHRIRYAPSLTALRIVGLWEQSRARPERPFWRRVTQSIGDPTPDWCGGDVVQPLAPRANRSGGEVDRLVSGSPPREWRRRGSRT